MKPKTNSEIVLYLAADGKTRLEVQFQGETAWLTQAQMAELFQTTQQNISLHLQNIFEEGELTPAATHKECLSVQPAATVKEFLIVLVNIFATGELAGRQPSGNSGWLAGIAQLQRFTPFWRATHD
jgi:hypothetical protein